MTRPRLHLLALAATVTWLAASHLHAQQTATYRFLMSPAQVRGFVDAWNRGGGYLPGETLVKFRDGMTPAAQTRALSVLRRTDGASTKWIGEVLMVSTPNDADAEGVAATLARQPEVEWAQPNYVRMLETRPNDADYSQQWNFDLIDLPSAWDINGGAKSSVTVAVVDSGVTTVDRTVPFTLWTGSQFEQVSVPFRISPDISASRIKPGRDFIFWEGPVLDMVGHGTHVASTVLEDTNNGTGAAGIAYQANLLPLKVCIGYWELQFIMSDEGIPGFVDPDETGGCSDSATAQAIRYAADSGAQVINISLGGEEPAPVLRDAMNYAVAHGAVIALAAGNEFDLGNPTEYPAAYAAEIGGAIAVGAVNRSSKHTFYSNTGSWVELAAPGGDVRDGGLNGLITQIGLLESDFDPVDIIRPRFDRYTSVGLQGTSMATPHVAGVAALLVAQGITNPAALEAAMERTATDLGAAGRDPEFGFGLVNPRAALRGMGLAK